MSEESKQPSTGGQIESIKTGGVADWLFNTVGLYKVRAAAASWLNFLVNINITLPDGTTRTAQARPQIAENSAALDLPIDLSQGGLIMSGDIKMMFPFKIYNISNNTGDSALDDYTFQIRSGVVSGRGYYRTGSSCEVAAGPSGNSETLLYCPGTDFKSANSSGPGSQLLDPATVNIGDDITVDTTAETLIADVITGVICAQIIVNQTPSNFGNCKCAIYLRLVDDPTEGLIPKMYARMYEDEGFDARSATPFPNEPEVIPIGICGRYGNTVTPFTFAVNYQGGNLINRYPSGSTTFRGRWSGDSLNGKVFYPGDIVIEDISTQQTITFTPGQSFSGKFLYYPIYTYIGTSPSIVSSPPGPFSGLWRASGMSPLP